MNEKPIERNYPVIDKLLSMDESLLNVYVRIQTKTDLIDRINLLKSIYQGVK